jgi:hypothetical protein
MRIKNLEKTTVWMGYEHPGFYLEPGAESEELPDSYLLSTYLQSDADAGRIQIIKDGKAVAPPPRPAKAVKPAEEDAPARKKEEPTTEAAPKKDPLKEAVRSTVDRIAGPEQKKEHLMEVIAGADGAKAKAAADVLVELTRETARKTAETKKELEASGFNEPTEPPARTVPPPEAKPKQKSPFNMTNMEVIKLAHSLGMEASVASDFKQLRKSIKERLEQEASNG